jgi:two-component system, NtrC family, nitrogen regulation sensor histidine kinase NtrY
VRREENLTNVLKDAVVLQEAGQPNVRFVTDIVDEAIVMDIDATMISQALTNLIKNGGEAIETYTEKNKVEGFFPEIRVSLSATPDHVVIRIADNGIGLPPDRARLFEPYVTTREKGTGLGLSIVKKIIEEHGGTLALLDADLFDNNTHVGAMAEIGLPRLRARNTSRKAEENL